MTEKYSLLPLNSQQLTPVQTAIQRMSEKHPVQTLCWMTHQQMIMNCIKLFVTLLKLTISKKWTLLSSCKTG